MLKSTKELARDLGLLRKRKSTTKNRQQREAKARQIFAYLVILDFESTCWNDKQHRTQEIIEFPAVLMKTSTGEILSEFHFYVQPTEAPTLSDFCKQLTGITQEQVNDAIPISICLPKYVRWLKSISEKHQFVYNTSSDENQARCTFVTWSDWDLGVCLQYELRRKQLRKPPELNSWIDLRATYRKFYARKPKGLNGALQDLGLDFEGREHSGIIDTRNTARLAYRMISDGCVLILTKTGHPSNNGAKPNIPSIAAMLKATPCNNTSHLTTPISETAEKAATTKSMVITPKIIENTQNPIPNTDCYSAPSRLTVKTTSIRSLRPSSLPNIPKKPILRSTPTKGKEAGNLVSHKTAIQNSHAPLASCKNSTSAQVAKKSCNASSIPRRQCSMNPTTSNDPTIGITDIQTVCNKFDCPPVRTSLNSPGRLQNVCDRNSPEAAVKSSQPQVSICKMVTPTKTRLPMLPGQSGSPSKLPVPVGQSFTSLRPSSTNIANKRSVPVGPSFTSLRPSSTNIANKRSVHSIKQTSTSKLTNSPEPKKCRSVRGAPFTVHQDSARGIAENILKNAKTSGLKDITNTEMLQKNNMVHISEQCKSYSAEHFSKMSKISQLGMFNSVTPVNPPPAQFKTLFAKAPVKSTMKRTPPMCECGRRSKRKFVQNPGPNLGRTFFCCGGPNIKSKQCKFFKWEISESERSGTWPGLHEGSYISLGGGDYTPQVGFSRLQQPNFSTPHTLGGSLRKTLGMKISTGSYIRPPTFC